MIRPVSANAEAEVNDPDVCLWHPWLRINRVLRVMRRSGQRGGRCGRVRGMTTERVSDGEGDGQSGCNIPFSSNNELKPERRLLGPQNKRAARGS